MNNPIAEMKTSLAGLNSRSDWADERIGKLGDKNFKIIQSEEQKKRTTTNEQRQRDLQDSIEHTNILTARVPGGEEREIKGKEKHLKKEWSKISQI